MPPQEADTRTMQKIKDTMLPREKFLAQGADALGKDELLALLLGGSIKGKNVHQLSRDIVEKFGGRLLTVTVDDLQGISGIGRVKALRIVAAISLVRRLYEENSAYIGEEAREHMLDLFGFESPAVLSMPAMPERHRESRRQKTKNGFFRLHNRRYLGNKYKLLGFIEDIVSEKCGKVTSFCDIFAGTGVVGERFNRPDIKIIANDFLYSNYACIKAFLCTGTDFQGDVQDKIAYLNNLPAKRENYFSKNFGGTYFTRDNARKIGAIREEIDDVAANEEEKNILICSLIYAVDKVANTVGHYDAFRKKMDTVQAVRMLLPDIQHDCNAGNEVHREDANTLIRKISCDVLYIDPPYNSRQYSDAYHLLENFAEWKKPKVAGVCKKMDRAHIKSDYCMKGAVRALAGLIAQADCRHILFSYNNTGASKDGRSNARISDSEILQILNEKGDVSVYEKNYKAFTTGKSNGEDNAERIFHCRVK